MKLGDYIRQAPHASADEARVGVSEKERARLRELLYREIPSERIAQLLAQGREQARRELAVSIEQILSAHDFAPMNDIDRSALIEHTLDLVLGLGPIEKMLKDDSITEIMVNGPRSVFFERDGVLCTSDERYDSEEQLRLVIDRIVSPLGRRIDEQSPIVNARLPEGHRVNVVIPPPSPLAGPRSPFASFAPSPSRSMSSSSWMRFLPRWPNCSPGRCAPARTSPYRVAPAGARPDYNIKGTANNQVNLNKKWGIMQFDNQLAKAAEEHEVACFRADLALSFPESYSLQEKKDICEDLLMTDVKVDEAMRNDFWAIPPKLRTVFFKMLLDLSELTEEYWRTVLDYWD